LLDRTQDGLWRSAFVVSIYYHYVTMFGAILLPKFCKGCSLGPIAMEQEVETVM
jgi:hypothetical protein